MEKVVLALKAALGTYCLAILISMLIGIIILLLRKTLSKHQKDGERA